MKLLRVAPKYAEKQGGLGRRMHQCSTWNKIPFKSGKQTCSSRAGKQHVEQCSEPPFHWGRPTGVL